MILANDKNKKMKFSLVVILLFFFNIVYAQRVGIGVPTPVESLEVNGNLKTNSLTLTNSGGTFDFLTKTAANGTVAYKKGHGGIGMHYIICVSGIFIPQVITSDYIGFLGEIRIFAGDFAPSGWMFCHGQHLSNTAPNTALLSILGYTYGSTDTTFALPDLRGLVPVGVGTHPSGLAWLWGQKSY